MIPVLASSPVNLRVAHIVDATEAEGPGRRFAIWVQGCPLRCPGCCNPEMFSERGGTERSVDDLISSVACTPDIEGITLLGGEPFAQAEACAELARRVRELGLSVVVFSGYALDELRAPRAQQLLAHTDVLFDGRYERDLPETRRRWIGSSNQQVHFLTDRYSPTDPRFFAANTVEIRLTAGGLVVNGWPAAAKALIDDARS